MQQKKPHTSLGLLLVIGLVVTSSFIMYACNDATPPESETPSGTDTATIDTTSSTRSSDTAAPLTDTTKGGQPVPPR